MRIGRLIALSIVLLATGAGAQVAERPPMGWNSWDSYGLTITEAQFRDNVKVEATVLKPYGWTYAVIDEGWFLENPQDRPTPEKLRYALDAYGRYVPVTDRFPSAAGVGEPSFAALGAWVHARGLKFGIHIVRGIPRESVRRNLPVEGSAFHAQDVADTSDSCPWDPTNWGVRDNAAGQAWYDALFRQYAAWGVDLIKVDCIGDHPYKVSEIRMIRRAIDRVGRPMVLSLSPGPMNLSHVDEVRELAQMWRISDDVWDDWTNDKSFPISVKSQFARAAAWARYARPGDWPDADMLPVGELRPSPGFGPARSSRLTHDEQQAMLALWSMARSPLILGANLTLLDEWTTKLLTARDVLRIDQTATASRQVMRDGDMIVWTADLPDGEEALAVFNVGDSAADIDRPLSAYGLKDVSWDARDAWNGVDLGRQVKFHGRLEPHSCAVWILHR
ncbi:MAG TPA: glycoside hydrolase family 27 protein [Acidobacteriaceae bacterium]|nr:glycoside hydrolase family 27 protein [Acidobacteriaceae bacterium]